MVALPDFDCQMLLRVALCAVTAEGLLDQPTWHHARMHRPALSLGSGCDMAGFIVASLPDNNELSKGVLAVAHLSRPGAARTLTV